MIIDERYVRNLVRFGKWLTLISIAVNIGAKKGKKGYGVIRWGIDKWGE